MLAAQLCRPDVGSDRLRHRPDLLDWCKLGLRHAHVFPPQVLRCVNAGGTTLDGSTPPGHKILSMTDDNFDTHNHNWKIAEGDYVLDASVLLPSENYLIEMEGSVDSNAVRSTLYIKPAAS